MMYRIGRRQKRALLSEDGHLVALFQKGQEELAQEICEMLNKQKQLMGNNDQREDN